MNTHPICTTRDAIKDGFPIVIGFLPIAMAFGILSKSAALTIWQSLGFSMIVFAGASQFIAVQLLVAGAGIGELILTTFLVNFRHVLFSASLSPKVTETMRPAIPFFAFGLTDEIFSVASLKGKELSKEYLLLLESLAYSAFAIGTAAGYLLGGVLPELVQVSMGIALYALFVAILAPELKKSRKTVFLIVLAGGINTAANVWLHIPQGWSIIITIVLVAATGVAWDVRNEARI